MSDPHAQQASDLPSDRPGRLGAASDELAMAPETGTRRWGGIIELRGGISSARRGSLAGRASRTRCRCT